MGRRGEKGGGGNELGCVNRSFVHVLRGKRKLVDVEGVDGCVQGWLGEKKNGDKKMCCSDDNDDDDDEEEEENNKKEKWIIVALTCNDGDDITIYNM